MLCMTKNSNSVFQAICGNQAAFVAATDRVHGATSVEHPYLGERLVLPTRHREPGSGGKRPESGPGRPASFDAGRMPLRDTSTSAATISRATEDVLNTVWAVVVIGRSLSS
jgi:hypothetical protein